MCSSLSFTNNFFSFNPMTILSKSTFGRLLVVALAAASCCAMMASCKSKYQRLLPLQGAYNVRDMGGYKAADGRQVAWGKVFRSGDLNKLTAADLSYLSGVGIKTYIDFRDSAEMAAAPDLKASTVVNEYALPISAGSIMSLTDITAANSPQLLVEGNIHFVRSCQAQYTEFFRILMDGGNAPLLFHCSAGKDRAGYAAVLFLSSLGVDRQTAISDYLLSAQYLKGKYEKEIQAHPELEPLLTVRREYIEAALNTIDREYGSMESYLTRYLHVDLGKMRELYTE